MAASPLAGAWLDIATQLLLPFLAGTVVAAVDRRLGGAEPVKLLGWVDRGSILLVVYTAFSDGVTHGIWHQVSTTDLLAPLLVRGCRGLAGHRCSASRPWPAGLFGFSRADEVAIVFCGSKKSLASGLPMATVLLTGQPVGLIVLPLMLFHQVQLMACAALAKRYAGAVPRVVAIPATRGGLAEAR